MAIVTKKIGPISAYAIAKEEGYTGTKEQFAQEIGNAAANAQIASTSASAAESSATSAASSASQAMSTTPAGYNSMMDDIAAEYSASATYAVGDYCRYNSKIYTCTTAIATAEAFDSTKWQEVVIGNEMGGLKRDIVMTQSAQPSSEYNRIWIPTSEQTEVQVPTYDEFNQLSEDLVDPNFINPTFVDKKFVAFNTGVIYDSNSYVYIEATGISTYHKLHVYTHVTGQPGICFYEADGTFISGIQNTSTEDNYLFDNDVDVPEGANIIRVSCLRTARTGLSINTKLKTILDGINDVISEKTSELKTGKVDNPYLTYTEGFFVGSPSAADSTEPRRAKTNPIKGGVTVSIKNAYSNGFRVSVIVWSDAPYGTTAYDTGWKNTNDLTIDVTGKYFIVGICNLPSGQTNVDMDALAAANITITMTKLDTDGIVVGLEMLSDMTAKTIPTIAHRGDDVVAPQCVAPSYIAARKNGCEIAENDLWLSEDGEFVMWHDTNLALLGNMVDINGYLMYTDGTDYYWVNNNTVYTWSGTDYVESSVALSELTRCAGANYGVNSEYNVTGLNLDVLKRIDFGVYKGPEFAGTQILTLEDWALLCKQLGMEIYIDRKLQYTDALLTAAANIVKKCGMAKHTSWLALTGAQITLLRTIIPDARVGLLYHPSAALIEAYSPYNTGRGVFFNGDARNGMTKEVIQSGLEAGFEVEVWWVGMEQYTTDQILATIRTAVSYGVTGMTLDHYKVGDAFKYLLA